tara:strand:+ start:864 stop:1046 length:183 start_codon:yes stop_codon:yes gene_type:complete
MVFEKGNTLPIVTVEKDYFMDAVRTYDTWMEKGEYEVIINKTIVEMIDMSETPERDLYDS